jgi:competence protein ComEA
MIRKFLREYFHFSRGEANGTIVLCAIMLLVFAFPHIYGILHRPSPRPADPELVAAIRAFYGEREDPAETPSGHLTSGYPADPIDHEPVRPAGNALPLIDLNLADSLDLMRVRGIGPVLSRRILRYRDLLGGYSNIEQLKEVYGFGEERYLMIGTRFFACSTRIIRLRPGHDDFPVLLRHPYLDFDQVSEIFRLRRDSRINSIEDLLNTSAFSVADIERLGPYLDFGSE